MSLVWDNFPGSGSELLVMLKFADYANDAGDNIYPSISTMAKHSRLSESQARRIIHSLIDQGWIVVVGNANGGAPGMTREYRINVDRLLQIPLTPSADATRTPSTDATPRIDATPSTHARDGSHGCARRVAPMTPDPSLSISDPSVSSSPSRARKAKAAPIPEDWKPDPRVYAWAEKNGLPREAIDRELDEFVVYWRGRGDARAGWDATFINRLKQIQRGPPAVASAKQATKTPRATHDDKFGERTYTGTPIDEIGWLGPGDT